MDVTTIARIPSPLCLPPRQRGCSGPRVVGRPIMSHNPRWVRLSRGRGEACTPLVSGVPRVPDIPCYPKRTAVIPQDLPRATRGRHEAARGVHAGCKTTRGHEGRRGGSGATVLGLTGGERINRIGSPRPWITFEIDARTRSRLGSPPFFTANFGIKSVTLYFVPYFFFCTGLTASFFLSFSRSKTNSSRYSRKRIS